MKSRIEIGIKSNQNRAKYPDLLNIFDDYYANYKENKFLESAYEAIMKIIISDVKKTERKLKDRNLFTKLVITMHPFKYLQENIDFGLFYEREEEELERLRNMFGELNV